MSGNEQTVKMVNNLDRAAIEARLAEVRGKAKAAGLVDVERMLADVGGAPRAKVENQVKGALKLLAGKRGHQEIVALLELVEINLPNL